MSVQILGWALCANAVRQARDNQIMLNNQKTGCWAAWTSDECWRQGPEWGPAHLSDILCAQYTGSGSFATKTETDILNQSHYYVCRICRDLFLMKLFLDKLIFLASLTRTTEVSNRYMNIWSCSYNSNKVSADWHFRERSVEGQDLLQHLPSGEVVCKLPPVQLVDLSRWFWR